MKITLVPNTDSFYDTKQLKNLASAFQAMGCEAIALHNPIKSHPNSICENLQESKKSTQIKYENIETDVLLEVNRTRDIKLKKKVRHICWFQDLKPSEMKPILEYGEIKKQEDLIYLLGDKKHFGLSNAKTQMGSLLSGLTEEECELNRSTKPSDSIDVNLLGYLPPFNKKKQGNKKNISRQKVLLGEIVRRPRLIFEILLRKKWHINIGDFENTEFFQSTFAFINKNYKPLSGAMIPWHVIQPKNTIDSLIYDLLYSEQPRWVDRMVIFRILKMLFENDKKVFIAGTNWKSSFPDCDFIQNHCENPLDIFRQSAITLHNNTHGIGIHSRVLEAMAAGSFIMMHASPCSHLPGGIDSSFEPELHYGLYSENNLAEKVEYWLAHSSQRLSAIKDCHSILRAKHLWRHRASQILGDLA